MNDPSNFLVVMNYLAHSFDRYFFTGLDANNSLFFCLLDIRYYIFEINYFKIGEILL